MTNPIRKFFDPATLPQAKLVKVPIDYFMMVRRKLQIDFSFPEDEKKSFPWNFNGVDKVLAEYKARGGKNVMVDFAEYELKIKTLAKS
ncbi:MAG: hypothetical protein CME71_00555 [Halobacteriovorax sp.]|nr:hypothetical protein [Halobacteriovorax sp.]|tara:strand:- start:521 stop:784 length:264 start_codon:yes stop_codon:yes gene_type:complete